jgi:hypothetical protein
MVSGNILLSEKHDAEEPRAPGKWFLTPFPLFPDAADFRAAEETRDAM